MDPSRKQLLDQKKWEAQRAQDLYIDELETENKTLNKHVHSVLPAKIEAVFEKCVSSIDAKSSELREELARDLREELTSLVEKTIVREVEHRAEELARDRLPALVRAELRKMCYGGYSGGDSSGRTTTSSTTRSAPPLGMKEDHDHHVVRSCCASKEGGRASGSSPGVRVRNSSSEDGAKDGGGAGDGRGAPGGAGDEEHHAAAAGAYDTSGGPRQHAGADHVEPLHTLVAEAVGLQLKNFQQGLNEVAVHTQTQLEEWRAESRARRDAGEKKILADVSNMDLRLSALRAELDAVTGNISTPTVVPRDHAVVSLQSLQSAVSVLEEECARTKAMMIDWGDGFAKLTARHNETEIGWRNFAQVLSKQVSALVGGDGGGVLLGGGVLVGGGDGDRAVGRGSLFGGASPEEEGVGEDSAALATAACSAGWTGPPGEIDGGLLSPGPPTKSTKSIVGDGLIVYQPLADDGFRRHDLDDGVNPSPARPRSSHASPVPPISDFHAATAAVRREFFPPAATGGHHHASTASTIQYDAQQHIPPPVVESPSSYAGGGLIAEISTHCFHREFARLKRHCLDQHWLKTNSELVQRTVPSTVQQLAQVESDHKQIAQSLLHLQSCVEGMRVQSSQSTEQMARAAQHKISETAAALASEVKTRFEKNSENTQTEFFVYEKKMLKVLNEKLAAFARLNKGGLLGLQESLGCLRDELETLKMEVLGRPSFRWEFSPSLAKEICACEKMGESFRSPPFSFKGLVGCELVLFPRGKLLGGEIGYATVALVAPASGIRRPATSSGSSWPSGAGGITTSSRRQTKNPFDVSCSSSSSVGESGGALFVFFVFGEVRSRPVLLQPACTSGGALTVSGGRPDDQIALVESFVPWDHLFGSLGGGSSEKPGGDQRGGHTKSLEVVWDPAGT